MYIYGNILIDREGMRDKYIMKYYLNNKGEILK